VKDKKSRKDYFTALALDRKKITVAHPVFVPKQP
jgi:hypothetical protein